MKKILLSALLVFTPVTYAETLEHVEQEVHIALETIQALKAEINELREAVKMQGEIQEASVSSIAKVAKKFEKLHIGGYGELHFSDTETDGGTESKSVDAHRFVLFFGYDFNDKVRFRSEFELEHAIAGEGKTGEIELEQMYLEWDINDATAMAVGVNLLPVGILNENHEPPTFYGVERNDVEKYIIPATWWAAGVGIKHKMANGLAFEAMIHEGLKMGVDGAIRDGRQKSGNATANDLAYSVRLSYSGFAGLKTTAFYQRQSDATNSSSDNLGEMDLYGATAIYQFGDGFEVRALHVQADLEYTDKTVAVVTNGFDEQQGTFVEMSKRINDFGYFVNVAKVDAYATSKQYTDTKVGISWWVQGTDAVIKANWFDHDMDSDALASSDSDGFRLGMGYEF
jgi:FtsZ-binding cell division protein ZapB